jgi:hypothetical protein
MHYSDSFINTFYSCYIFRRMYVIITFITNYINFNATQQATRRKPLDCYVHTSKHVGAVECINKLSKFSNFWYIVEIQTTQYNY